MSDVQLNKGQERAQEEIVEWTKQGGMAISLSGPAGTGKTFLTKYLMPLLRARYGTITLTATTGKAALRLAALTGQKTSTLHKALYETPDDETNKAGDRLFFDKRQPAPGGLLIVDESSMITPDVWKDLQEWMKEGTRILFIGDGFQLPPVMEADATDDFNIFSLVQGPRLIQVMRNGDVILDAATALRVEGKLIREDLGAYRWRRAKLSDVLGDWLGNQDDHAIITWRNRIRMLANRVIRKAKGCESQFPMPGEPILIRRNSRGLLNGQIVTAVEESKPGPKLGEKIQASWVKVHVHETDTKRLVFASCQGREEIMDGGFPRLETDEWKAYLNAKRRFEYGWGKEQGWKKSDKTPHPPRMDPTPITYGYCLTCHAGQGSEWKRVTVYLDAKDTTNPYFQKLSVLPDGTRVPFYVRWLYTSLTRAKNRVEIAIGL